MARIEGVYQKWLRTIPKEKITTLSHKESMEIDMAISDAFCRKAKIARQKQSFFIIPAFPFQDILWQIHRKS